MAKKKKNKNKPANQTTQVSQETTSVQNTETKAKSAPVYTGNRLPLMFGKENYRLMLIGLGVIFLGLLLMIGKNNTDPNAPFPANDIYSFRRIILAPIVIISGFLIEVYSILLIRKQKK